MPNPAIVRSTRSVRPPTLADFLGQWLVNRSDALNLPKGAVVGIERTGNSEHVARFWMRFNHLFPGETMSGEAKYKDGYLTFRSDTESYGVWFVQATVAIVVQNDKESRFLFGIDIFGDPQNAGVWGAEQDGP
jgi:hypothetical protein